MKLIVLRTGDAAAPVAARRGEFFSWIRREAEAVWNGAWREHDVRDMTVPLPRPTDADGFIVTGSSSSVTERAPWMLRTEELLRELVNREVPLFGICFGHQMIGEALGGKVAKNPRGREIGTVEVRVRADVPDDPVLRGLPRAFSANATHVDSVVVLPPGARVLAETSLEPHAVYAVGKTTKCVQFHPEIDGDAMRGYVDARAHLVTAEGLDAEAIRARVVDTPDGASTLRNFIRHVVLETKMR
ncbi:MAG TPA: glutamine amidotransferase, partial [Labilithrix sp.]|nr:glutamine amidotransferase [Labilithrix sp.]